MQTTTTETSCILCEQEISNPICSDCLAVRMQAWLSEKNEYFASKIEGFALEGKVNCLFCGKSMALCAHCFSEDVYYQLRERDAALAKEFMARFDFDLRKELVAE